MKIIVYNYKNQFALSRKQIETIKSVLPNEYFAPIRELHITTGSPGQERFEFEYDTKSAHFEYKVEQKTKETTCDAIEHLLIGLKRIKEKDSFGHFINESDRERYESFINEWKPKCLNELEKIKNRR
ncbi:MAG: hypothetical protein R2759_17410 [Bacteroidales bacterium]